MKEDYLPKRIWATIIDYTLVYILTFVYIYIVGKPNGEGGHTVSGLPALVPVLFWFIYFVISEQYMQGTLGHHLFRLRVISQDGRKVTLARTFSRRICDALEISWCFGLIAFLIARNTPNNQRLGDFVAKTMVTGKTDSQMDVAFDFEKRENL